MSITADDSRSPGDDDFKDAESQKDIYGSRVELDKFTLASP
jgi:hypothetical protein